MAEVVTIGGQSYGERDPLGVLGPSFITFGIDRFSVPPPAPGSMPPPPP